MGRTTGSGVGRRPANAVLGSKPGGGLGLSVKGGLRDRQREQRKRIIKMCVQKLRDIDDPETVLCRAVLINNTFRTLKTAQRAIMRNARRRVLERKESSEEEDEVEEKGEKEKKGEEEEDEEISITSPPPSQPLPSLRQESRPNFSESELSDLSCDIGCSDSSMVHSLVMPPLLSPHIEDMTNCSFYDSFGPVDLGVNNQQQTEEQTNNQDQESNVPTNLKLTMMKSDLCDVISETNSNSGGNNSFSFPKSEFGSCGGPSEAPDMLDTLLTEISQA